MKEPTGLRRSILDDRGGLQASLEGVMGSQEQGLK